MWLWWVEEEEGAARRRRRRPCWMVLRVELYADRMNEVEVATICVFVLCARAGG